jgi:hypothetical protein
MSLENRRVCRFCLTEKEPLKDIFTEETAGDSVLLKSIYVLSINANKGDKKPKFICTLCDEMIDLFNKFKTNCFTCERIADVHPMFPIRSLESFNMDAVRKVIDMKF